MKPNTRRFVLLFMLLIANVNFVEARISVCRGRVSEVHSIEKLDSISLFSIKIFGDNRGASSASCREMENLCCSINDNTLMIIGLGNHVKHGYRNYFADFIESNADFTRRFFPVMGSDEYGFEGALLFDKANLHQRDGVQFAKNGEDYYARVECEDFTVHFIALGFANKCDGNDLFPHEKTQFLLETLAHINKTDHDIVIVAAQSITGSWHDLLTLSAQETLFAKCDLLLSGAANVFQRLQLPETFNGNEPLALTTGSVTRAEGSTPNGYIEVHVLQDVTTNCSEVADFDTTAQMVKNVFSYALVAQYLDATKPVRQMQSNEFAYLKIVGGRVLDTDFCKRKRSEEYFPLKNKMLRPLSAVQLDSLMDSFLRKSFAVDFVLLESATCGIDTGVVTNDALWQIYPHNDDVIVLNLDKKQLEVIFGKDVPFTKNQARVAVDAWHGHIIVKTVYVTDKNIRRTGFGEFDLLRDCVQDFMQFSR